MTHAVIFDMDGLLIDSEPLWKEAEIEVFGSIGVPMTLQLAKQTTGMREDEAVEHWYNVYHWKGPTTQEVYDMIIEKVIQLIKARGEARAGAYKVIKMIREKILPTAIASSSSTAIINAVVEKLGIQQDIDVIHSAEDEAHGKPHPDVYLTAAKKLNIDSQHCLAFEDTPKGVRAAKAAGMRCIAVPDEFMKEDKTFEMADVVLDSLEDFKEEYLQG